MVLSRPSVADARNLVHPSAFVDQGCKIGEGTRIWHFSHVLSGSTIGCNCNLGQNVVVGPNVRIGDRVKIQNNVSIYQGVTLEDEVFCGPSMVFTTSDGCANAACACVSTGTPRRAPGAAKHTAKTRDASIR